MVSALNRREFLTTTAGGAIGLALPRATFGQGRPATIAATKLSENLLEITGAGANVIVLTGPDGVLMVDGGLPDSSADLLRLIAEQTGERPVRVLFNTHWHLDHTGSNETLGKAGAKIVAHQNTNRWLSSRVLVEAQKRTYEPRPAEAIPTETVAGPAKTTFGKEPIEYGPLPPGHTNGDLYVFFPAQNVLVVSDALSVARYPIMDYSTGGWIGGLIDATNVLLKIADGNTRVVPGAGALQTKDDLQAQLDMLTKVKERVLAMLRQGKSVTDVAAEAPTKEFDAKWGKPDLFLTMTYTGMLRHTHEIGGIL
jgi:glyoxylase-like metal-dependent hydrolase (beta-lactamase superfamily II)